jgi:hypothetical protein
MSLIWGILPVRKWFSGDYAFDKNQSRAIQGLAQLLPLHCGVDSSSVKWPERQCSLRTDVFVIQERSK